jgi:hypothetical protein
MAEMAKQSATGNLTSFAGLFSVTELPSHDKEMIEGILREYTSDLDTIEKDLVSLISITSEVKAINNQAAVLHGERIKKAQEILTRYKDGAFTAWMIAAYGNRQTPYNLLLYYEFYNRMPKTLRPQIEAMPRQAIYTLASRDGSSEKKQEIVQRYNGETKQEILGIIRESFPLDEEDKRKSNAHETLILNLQRITNSFKRNKRPLTNKQKTTLIDLLDHLKELVKECKTR